MLLGPFGNARDAATIQIRILPSSHRGGAEGKMSKRFIVLTAVLACLTTSSSAANLNCKAGPLTKTFGGTQWSVYGCDDNASLVIITAPGNPAMPFYFLFTKSGDRYHVEGEGTGSKTLTDAAYKDLSALTDADIAAMSAQAHRRSN
jgi:hypothetical protein